MEVGAGNPPFDLEKMEEDGDRDRDSDSDRDRELISVLEQGRVESTVTMTNTDGRIIVRLSEREEMKGEEDGNDEGDTVEHTNHSSASSSSSSTSSSPSTALLSTSTSTVANSSTSTRTSTSESNRLISFDFLSKMSTVCDSNSFDLRSIFDAAQVISSEIVLTKLLGVLTLTLVRNTGADRAILLSRREKRCDPSSPVAIKEEGASSSSLPAPFPPPPSDWLVDACAVGEECEVFFDLSSNENNETGSAIDYSKQIFNFVLHSKQSLILHDASSDPLFRRDPFIQKNGIRSVLCLPLIHRNQLVSVLYLENSIMCGVFSRERLMVCRVLAGQAAISILNARLYQELNQSNARLQHKVVELEKVSMLANQANLAKSQFLASMSHELRTPMSNDSTTTTTTTNTYTHTSMYSSLY